MSDLTVTFRSVKDWPRYYVSDHGHLWKQYKNGKIKELKRWKSGNGYPYWTLRDSGRERKVGCHVLVAETFLPAPELDHPDQYIVVNHKDGNKDNTRLSNLEWLKGNGNLLHAMAEGLWKRRGHGKRNGKNENGKSAPAQEELQ